MSLQSHVQETIGERLKCPEVFLFLIAILFLWYISIRRWRPAALTFFLKQLLLEDCTDHVTVM